MRTITIEEHFLAEGFKQATKRRASSQQRGGAANQARANELGMKLSDLDTVRLKSMDAGGIDFQVISHMTLAESFPDDEAVRLAREANDQLAAAVAAHPTRFAGFATLPMTQPEAAVDELERAVRILGFKGAMIHGTTQGRFLDDPSFLPILERAVALDVPIYIHPAVPPASVWEAYYVGFDPAVSYTLSTSAWGWHSEVGIHALRMILGGVFDRLPTLQIIIGHMGEMLPFMLARIDSTLTPVARHLPRKVSEYFLQNFYITTSGFFSNAPLLLAMEIMGADRIIFSVDYPYSTNEQGRIFLDNMAISPIDKEKISHLNAERLLKLAGA